MNCLKRSCDNVRVSPVTATVEGKNCRMLSHAMRCGGEEVKFARNVRSPKYVYRITSIYDDVRLLCTTGERVSAGIKNNGDKLLTLYENDLAVDESHCDSTVKHCD
jgi:hypothetical protein